MSTFTAESVSDADLCNFTAVALHRARKALAAGSSVAVSAEEGHCVSVKDGWVRRERNGTFTFMITIDGGAKHSTGPDASPLIIAIARGDFDLDHKRR